MSRLSRFKKPPALKLPKKLDRGRFGNDSDEDDDFKQPIRPLEVKPKTRLTQTTANSAKSQTKNSGIVSSGSDSSFSQYFSPPKEEIKKPSKKASQASVRETVENPSTSERSACNPSKKESSKSQEEDISPPNSENNSSDGPKNTVLCPFCWKKLADKLTGTTHIKSCAKNLPIEQIHEAMLLQERQIEEWKQLGLDFPAFSVDNKRTKKGTSQPTRGKGKEGRRRKKNEEDGGVDPQLELAMALSVSLHKELESRQQDENKFLIENGLDEEIGLVEVSSAPISTSSTSVASKKPMKSSLAEVVPSTTITSRRRGKKLVLESLPLHTVSDLEKKSIIERRRKEKKRKKIFTLGTRCLLAPSTFRNACTHSKISCARGPPDTPAQAYSVLDLNLTGSIGIMELSADTKPSEINNIESDCAATAVRQGSSGSTMESNGLNSVGIDNEEVEVSVNPKTSKPSSSITAGGDMKLSNHLSTGSASKHDERRSSSCSPFSKIKLPSVICDIARMLFDGIDCDIVIYGREERPIKCHRFMLSARCPKILSEIVVEEKLNHPNRHIIPLTSYTHETVKAFVWYVYSGTVEYTKETVLSDLQELGSTYGIKIRTDLKENKSDERKSREQTITRFTEAEVQTDVICTKNSSSMTECSDSGVSTNLNYALPDNDNNSRLSSQELFETSSPGISPNADQQIKNVSVNISDQSEESNSTQLSVDLFEDVESCVKPEVDSDAERNRCTGELEVSSNFNIDGNLESPGKDDQNDDNDDDDYLKHLASPAKQNSWRSRSSEKKRCRSVSPLVDAYMYSATQAANILQTRQNGGNVIDNVSHLKKASKKQKLDHCTSFDTRVTMDVVTNNCGLNDDCVIDKWDDKTSSVVDSNTETKFALGNSKVDSIQRSSVASITPKTKRASRMSRRSISTPNLTPISNSRRSPFYNLQEKAFSNNDGYDRFENACNDDFDPFENGCDDSIFAKIPDDVFITEPQSSSCEPASRGKNTKKKDAIPSCHTSSTPSRTQRNLSLSRRGRDYSSQSPSHSYNDTASLKTTRNKKTKAKEKPKPKLKLPKNIASVQEGNVPARHSYSTPIIADDRASSSATGNVTPLLNYSLIDTPILKQELKKFGIKPLPRSKAKVLLRHIYKETHK